MSLLLFACAFDLNGERRFQDREQALAASLEQGIAGTLHSAALKDGVIAMREAYCAGSDPASRPDQPPHHKGTDGALTVLVGRLHERKDVARKLSLPDDANDAALYAAAFDAFGEGCDAHLIGDYAALRYHPEHRTLRLARSPMSMQPVHVWRDGHSVVAASLPQSLIAMGLASKVNARKLEDSLLLNFRNAAESWYDGAHRVAAGTVERHDREGAQVSRFWSVGQVPDVSLPRDEDYVEALDALFRRAIKAEAADVSRPAVMLSGGLDSQCVASYLAQANGSQQPILSYTSVPQEGWTEPHKPYSFGDERAHVEALAAHYPQIRLHFVTAQERSFGDELDEMIRLGGWPMRNESNLHWIHAACVLAADAGCDAMFSGAAGNATFSYDGATGYATWLRQGRLAKLLQELRQHTGDQRRIGRKFLSLAALPHVPLKLQKRIKNRHADGSDLFVTWCPMRETYAQEHGVLERARQQGFDPEFLATSSSREWRQWAFADLLSEGPEIELAFHLRYGFPTRDPTMFQPLAEFTIGTPDDQFLRNGETRWLARRLLKGRIPEAVRQETRMGRQSPDWALRFARERGALLAAIDQLRDDSQLSDVLDLDRLSQDMATWNGEEDIPGVWKRKIHAGVGRALSTARFVRYVERRNVGA